MIEQAGWVDWQKLVQRHLPGCRLERVLSLDGGSSALTTLLTIRNPAGEEQAIVIRQPTAQLTHQNPRAAWMEYQTLGLLQTKGLPAPKPIFLDETRSILPQPCLAIEYIAGSTDFAPADPPLYAAQMATVLAALHTVNWTDHQLAHLPRAEKGLLRELAAQREPHRSLREDDIRAALNGYTQTPERFALLHGDFWPGNILWNTGRLACIIDWEDAAAGDPLVDFAIARLEIMWIYGRRACDTFTAVYRQQTGFAMAQLPYYDLYAALRLIRMAGADMAGWTAFFPPRGRPDITAQSLRADLLFFIDQALGNSPKVF